MPRSSRTIITGYKYSLGTHMGMVHGPVDCLVRIRVADKVVWTGTVTDGPISINQPEIFGGTGAEGGIVGTVRFENGQPNQQTNDYLRSQLGDPLPAFRGVSCVVLEQVYVTANNPYLKPWAATMTRTDVTTRGAAQWYPEKARISYEESQE